LGAKHKEDMIMIMSMARLFWYMCRSHHAVLKASSTRPPAWVGALPRRRGEAAATGDESALDGNVDEEAAEHASRRVLARRCPSNALPPSDDPAKAEKMTVTGVNGRILRRCTREVADGTSFVYGWDPETLCAWRIWSESKSNQQLLSEPLKVPDGAAPHDFMVGRWPDGSTHQINRTVEAFKELTWAEAMERALYQEAMKDSASNRGANTDAISDAGFVGEGRGLPVVATTRAMAKVLAGKATARASFAEAKRKKAAQLAKRYPSEELDRDEELKAFDAGTQLDDNAVLKSTPLPQTKFDDDGVLPSLGDDAAASVSGVRSGSCAAAGGYGCTFSASAGIDAP
jgi:hypothetical protein